MAKAIQNFRELKRVTMVDVVEGSGTDEDPKRIVHYVYDEDTYIGKIDNSIMQKNEY